MNDILNRDLILEAASQNGIEPAFIEKDWYTVQFLNSFENDHDIELFFSVCTDLSKGFGLIKCF